MRRSDVAPDVDREPGRIHGNEVADRPVERRPSRVGLFPGGVEQPVPPQVVLLGREGIAPGLLALPFFVERADRFEESERVGLVHELFR
jgi:hypothetical protein